MTTRGYKNLKGLAKESLKDNMTNIELVPNMLAEVTTTTISKTEHHRGTIERYACARMILPSKLRICVFAA